MILASLEEDDIDDLVYVIENPKYSTNALAKARTRAAILREPTADVTAKIDAQIARFRDAKGDPEALLQPDMVELSTVLTLDANLSGSPFIQTWKRFITSLEGTGDVNKAEPFWVAYGNFLKSEPGKNLWFGWDPARLAQWLSAHQRL
jgi:hypothetical protein